MNKRNKPCECECESGKKYKQCCLPKEIKKAKEEEEKRNAEMERKLNDPTPEEQIKTYQAMNVFGMYHHVFEIKRCKGYE